MDAQQIYSRRWFSHDIVKQAGNTWKLKAVGIDGGGKILVYHR